MWKVVQKMCVNLMTRPVSRCVLWGVVSLVLFSLSQKKNMGQKPDIFKIAAQCNSG